MSMMVYSAVLHSQRIREVALEGFGIIIHTFGIHSEEVIEMFVYLENLILLRPFRPSFWY